MKKNVELINVMLIQTFSCNFKFETYFDIVYSDDFRNIFFEIRLNSHKLEIETG